MAAYEPGKVSQVERWRPFVRKYLPHAPEDFILAWIQHESNGNPRRRTTDLDERGILQIHPEEAASMGLTAAEWAYLLKGPGDSNYSADTHFRLSTRLIHHREETVQRYMRVRGFQFTGEDYWTAVKLVHGLPAILDQGAKAFIAANSYAPSTFAALAGWLRDTSWSYRNAEGKTWSAARVSEILSNAESAGRWARSTPTRTPGAGPLIGVAALMIGLVGVLALWYDRGVLLPGRGA